MKYSLRTPYIGSFETRQLHHHYLADYNPAYGLLYDFHNNPHCLFVKLDMDPEEATLLALQLPNTIIKPFDPNIVADYLSSSLDEFLYSSPAT
jgi:hypothetical protein